MDKETLNEILRKHKLWLKDDPNGERANLRHADLADADLKNTDLSYANLADANLKSANLRYANLEGANLENANLEDANLEDANLRYAVLEGTHLTNAILTQTNTQNIRGQNVISVQVNTSRVNNTISYWKDLGIWTTGCFQGTLEELQERVAETHKDNPFLRKRYERVIEFILSEAEQDDKKADQRQLIDYILKYTS